MTCKNCKSERGLIRREYEGGTESYCSFKCYQIGVSKTRQKAKKLLDRDDIAEQGGKCLILAATLKLNMEAQLERAKAELDQMIEEEIRKYNGPKRGKEEYVKRMSRVALFYRHVAFSEVNRPTALKLAVKYVACGILMRMLDERSIDENLVESYLKNHANIADFSECTCNLCNESFSHPEKIN